MVSILIFFIRHLSRKIEEGGCQGQGGQLGDSHIGSAQNSDQTLKAVGQIWAALEAHLPITESI